eukprot:TRINITY_DN7717_c0_g3_i1.p1 TRINITY_DN7717_c0_g3~~TRINITY_DN7717_c0_g3_i1.p1  ORF type:complete len:736 (-),score=63.56 TRINITY_DN7717_c0_g3_i1:357-2564(-)
MFSHFKILNRRPTISHRCGRKRTSNCKLSSRRNFYRVYSQKSSSLSNSSSLNGQNTTFSSASSNTSLVNIPQNGNSSQETYKAKDEQIGLGFSLPKPLTLLTVKCDQEQAQFPEKLLDQITQVIGLRVANAILLQDCDLSSKSMLKLANQLYALCDTLQIHFLIEERIEIAALSGAHGIVVNSLQDIYDVRNFLEKGVQSAGKGKRWVQLSGASVNVVNGQNSNVRPILCGRKVYDEQTANFANIDGADFVVVDVDQRLRVSDRELKTELRAIRRRFERTVIANHQYVQACGGPKSVMNSGADGLEIPLDVLIKLIQKETKVKGVKEAAQQLPSGDRLAGAIMLVAGGTIGAGIIALPVKTAAAGFIPTAITLSCSWFFMCLTALLLLEMSIWYGPGTNLTTMAQNTLGKYGKIGCAVLYLFIYTATITAYIAEGARYLSAALGPVLQFTPMWISCLGFAAVFGGIVQAGTKWADKVNGYCVIFALTAYAYLLACSSQTINLSNLLAQSWQQTIPTLPIMVVAFCFHNIVPSLLGYLGTARRVFTAIVVGSFVPLVMYLIWEGVILGQLQQGVALTSTEQIVEGLRMVAGDNAVMAVTWFSLFAIITSFLGVLLGFVDFNKELLFKNVKSSEIDGQIWSFGGLMPLLSTIVPPLIIAVGAPGIFYSAMEFSGTLRMVLFGVIPVAMVWIGRRKRENKPFLPGGKPLLIWILVVALSMIFVEVRAKILYLKQGVVA